MIIDCISDLHGAKPKFEGGDLLIVAGDLTARDTMEEHAMVISWMESQKYKKIVFIAGNHDNFLQKNGWDDSTRPEYLCDSGTEFEGLKIWGSPWTKTFEGMNPHCKAFTVDTEEELAEKWALIPDDIDILITHSPPWGQGDGPNAETRYGSKTLLRWNSNHVNSLKLHVFGHIHEGHGIYDIRKWQKESGDPLTTVFVNASHVNERYEPVNKPVRIEL